MSGEFLRVEGVTKKYGDFTALDNVSIDVQEGEFVCLLGPSGCGKTTLLRIIAGLEKANAGKIYLKGKDVTDLHPSKRNFGIVFQSYALFPNMKVKQNIAFGLKGKHKTKEEINAKVQEVLELVNLADQADKYPSQLSGGQQQRIALARALALSPDFLLLDEPLSALDAKIRQKVRREIKELQAKLGITTIMVTHDQEEALTMADKVVVMNNACIRQVGSPQEVYDKPVSPFVADFIGAISVFYGDISAHGERAAEVTKNSLYRMKAIRPENVRIVTDDEPEGLDVIVSEVEFHGPSYRLTLSLDEKYRSTLGDYTLSIDVMSRWYTSLGIEKGKKIRVRLEEEKILIYNTDKEKAYTDESKEVVS